LLIPLPLAVSFSKQFGSLYLPTSVSSGAPAGPTPSEANNQFTTDDMIIKPAVKEKFKKLFGQYFDALSRKAVSDHVVSFVNISLTDFFFRANHHFSTDRLSVVNECSNRNCKISKKRTVKQQSGPGKYLMIEFKPSKS
jgi:hypothetical protein